MMPLDHRLAGRGELSRTLAFTELGWEEMFASISRDNDDTRTARRVLLTREGAHHYMTAGGRPKTKRVDVTLSCKQLFRGSYARDARWVQFTLTPDFIELFGERVKGMEEGMYLKLNHWGAGGPDQVDLLLVSAGYTSIIGGMWLNVLTVSELPELWRWTLFGPRAEELLTVDMDQYRSPGVSVFSGYDRGGIISVDSGADPLDPANMPDAVLFDFPDDIISVSTSFWGGLAGPLLQRFGARFSEHVFVDGPDLLKTDFRKWHCNVTNPNPIFEI